MPIRGLKREELSAIRTIISCQRVNKLWLAIIGESLPLRAFCYLPHSLSSSTHAETSTSTSPCTKTSSEPPPTWTQTPTATPSFRYNPFISTTILSHQKRQESNGREDPWLFNGDCRASKYGPPTTSSSSSSSSEPRQTWSFCFQISREKLARFHSTSTATPRGDDGGRHEESWREMYVTNPPFYSAWRTRCEQMPASEWLLSEGMGFQEDDYNDDDEHGSLWTMEDDAETGFRARLYRFSKRRQKCRISRPEGFRLGDLVDAVEEGFAMEGDDGPAPSPRVAPFQSTARDKVKWIAIESFREDELEADWEDVRY